MMMFGDPDFFEIKTLKQMGLWPTEKMVSRELAPYIRRMNKPVSILEVGHKKGENAIDLMENCNVGLYQGVKQVKEYEPVLQKNTKDGVSPAFVVTDEPIGPESDVIIFDCDTNLELFLEQYYPYLRKGGIICGNGHDTMRVKAAITTFRRKNKISVPINVATGTVWFWYKP